MTDQPNPLRHDLKASSKALLYGSGVFTTIAVVDGRPSFWEKHWRRLVGTANKMGIATYDLQEDKVISDIYLALREGLVIDGRVLVTIFDNRPADIWPSSDSETPRISVSILIGEKRVVADDLMLTTSRYPINSCSPLAGVKSCNYLEPIMSLDEAKVRGFHEAIRLNERGFVTSACMSNLFWLAGDELFTPSLSTGCLAGTTREFVLENIDCREVEAGIEDLANAEAIFLTSAGIGVQRVAEFEGKRLEMVDHPILHLLPY